LTVVLDYRLAPNWKSKMPRKNWTDLSREEVAYYSFVGSIVFRVGVEDFSADWGWIPLVDFGLVLDAALEDLPRSHEYTIEFTDSDHFIRMEIDGTKVMVASSYAHGRGRAGLTDLRAAVDRYMRRLLNELREATATP
jgi:hypothetical protein